MWKLLVQALTLGKFEGDGLIVEQMILEESLKRFVLNAVANLPLVEFLKNGRPPFLTQTAIYISRISVWKRQHSLSVQKKLLHSLPSMQTISFGVSGDPRQLYERPFQCTILPPWASAAAARKHKDIQREAQHTVQSGFQSDRA